MNKSLILVLAICLVSVHAFVKRDAPPEKISLDEISEKMKDIGATVQKAFEEFTDPKNVDELKNQISAAISNAGEIFQSMKAEAPKA